VLSGLPNAIASLWSVGPAVPATPEKEEDVRYHPDGSIKSYRIGGQRVEVAPKYWKRSAF
jgi:hypothetical protein